MSDITVIDTVPMGPEDDGVERLENQGAIIEIGQWYWATTVNWSDEVHTWLGCVVEIGSNFVKVEGISGTTCKVHMDNFDKVLQFEPNHRDVIQGKVNEYRDQSAGILNEIKAVTARLGMEQQTFLGHQQAQQESSRSLATLSGTEDPKAYEVALKEAKEKTLPELFEQMEDSNKSLTMWMKAEAVPLKALAGGLKDLVETIDGRIFNVSLYAGLIESIIQIKEGEPASTAEKLHLMQRKLYMDEESLLHVADGGMGFDAIEEFDEWLCQPENLERIMPFQRCMVAFQIRREDKDYPWDGTLAGAFKIADKQRADKMTFLYIRNGENVHCLGCDLDFGELIFPAKGTFDPSGPMMMKSSHSSVEFMGVNEYEDRVKEYKKAKEKRKQEEAERLEWRREHMGPEPKEKHFTVNVDGSVTYKHPGNEHGGPVEEVITYEDIQKKMEDADNVHSIGGYSPPSKERWKADRAKWAHSWRHDVWRKTYDRMPYGGYFHDARHDGFGFHPKDWKPFDSSNVDFDSGTKKLAKQIEYYNRIALLIQGLYDRSMVLHPHPPVRLYTSEGFDEAVELVFDGTGVVFHGEEPDIDAYMEANNAAIDADSVLMGQYNKWYDAEYEKDKNWRWWGGSNHFSLPNGNEGPHNISRMLKFMPKARKGVFSWTRECQNWRHDWRSKRHYGDPIYCSFTCPVEDLFNISAYKPGDMRRFYEDPRTRMKYLKWAKKFVTAERFHRGLIDIEEPVKKEDCP